MGKEKVLVAMSGGVDSSLATVLLKEAGYDCQGASMLLWEDEDHPNREMFDRAEASCRKLGIDYHLLDFRQEFKEKVVKPFVESYEQGLTPNPCVLCNRVFKFGLFLKAAEKLGCDKMATGHYARLVKEGGTYYLKKPLDRDKDQTYFLSQIPREVLPKLVFPLSSYTKDQVREMAKERGLAAASLPDSQDICFVANGDYLSFLEAYRGGPYPPADLVDKEGKVLGQGRSLPSYTVGQRRNLGLALGKPAYVQSFDLEANQVLVGPEEALYKDQLWAGPWNWLGGSGDEVLKAGVKVRYNASEVPARLIPGPLFQTEGPGLAKEDKLENLSPSDVFIQFDRPVRALAPGQFAVAYQGDILLGGGMIKKS